MWKCLIKEQKPYTLEWNRKSFTIPVHLKKSAKLTEIQEKPDYWFLLKDWLLRLAPENELDSSKCLENLAFSYYCLSIRN